jgi:hypothetical protein
LHLAVGGVEMYIDLGAEELIGAEKGGERIAVEVKSFIRPSAIAEFHLAVGQFMNYRRALAEDDPDRSLYLAVPREAFKTFFALPFVQDSVEEYQLRLVVYDAIEEEIVQWQR